MSEALIKELYKVTDKTIFGFFREHRFLSNFHLIPIEWEGLTYSSTEAAFQASKSTDQEERKRFTLYDPSTSKQEGGKIKLREGWEEMKDDVMFRINMVKFSNPDLKKLLLKTGERELVEDNWWHDTYWGRHFGEGANRLGVILMRVRDILKVETA